MSLQHAAQHLAAQGRGPDSTLVHMAPREVQGLQALAKAHGGSLTINPQTGLAEAGFLSNILPTLIGVGLTAATGGAAAPWMIGAGVGGLQALRTGSLSQGLMAGMGAYGGAGLASGLTSMGAQAAGEQAGAQALGTTPEAMATEGGSQAALTTNPAANPQGFDAFGNTPSQTIQGGYDPSTSGSYMDPTKGQQYSQAYADAAKPSSANFGRGFDVATSEGGGAKYLEQMGGGSGLAKTGLAAAAPAMAGMMAPQSTVPGTEHYTGPLSKYRMSEDYNPYNPTPPNPYYQAQYKNYQYAGGGSVEQMSNANAIGENTGFPMANIHQGAYATPWQTPMSQNVVEGTADTGVDQITGEENRFAGGGGISDLGGYSDGGRMLKGPGNGTSDSIPAVIGDKQPARLADGEFVVPARIVSELGNGSTDAGARQLYAMMDRIQKARGKTVGKDRVAVDAKARNQLPA